MEQRSLFDEPNPPWTIQAQFEAWLAENPHVYAAFLAAARDLRRRGRERFGAKAIYEHLRWNTAVGSVNGEWKLPNNYTSRLARLLLQRYPDEFEGFLRLCPLRRA